MNGGIPVPRTPKVSEQAQGWIDRFVSDLEAKEDLSPKTLKEYASDLRHLADWFEATWNSHREEETLFLPRRSPQKH
jgi:integrase/recombinase XerD